MANVRIKDITTTASALNDDDYLAIDGVTGGTRKILAKDLQTETDTTLSISGQAADAKATGDEIIDLKSTISEIPLSFTDGYYITSNNIPVASTEYSYSDYIKVVEGEQLHIINYFHDNPRMVFVNETKAEQTAGVVQAIQNTASGTFLYDNVVTVPAGAMYLRISCRTNSKSNARIIRFLNVSIDKILETINTSYTKQFTNWVQGLPGQPQNKNRVSIYVGKCTGGKLYVSTVSGMQYSVNIYDSEYLDNCLSSSGWKQVVTETVISPGTYPVVIACKTNYTQLDSFDAEGLSVKYVSTIQGAIENNDIYKLLSQNGINREIEVPYYYIAKNYLDGKIDRINTLAKASGGNGDTFVFITDLHWKLNTKNSPALLNYLYNATHIKKLFGGGDYSDTKNVDDTYFEVGSILRDAWPGDRYFAIGNHEYLGKTGTEITTDNNLAYYYESYHGNDVIYGSVKRNYFYIDNVAQKIRYIILNRYSESINTGSSANDGLETDQLSWLENTALNVNTGWTIVIFLHNIYGFTIIDDETVRPFVTTAAIPLITILENYSGNGTIAAVITGHAHFDIVVRLTNNIPVIVTTCDKNKTGGETPVYPDMWTDRASGTIREQAFDVITLDKVNREITAVRIGNPATMYTKNTDGDYIRGVDAEERVITY